MKSSSLFTLSFLIVALLTQPGEAADPRLPKKLESGWAAPKDRGWLGQPLRQFETEEEVMSKARALFSTEKEPSRPGLDQIGWSKQAEQTAKGKGKGKAKAKGNAKGEGSA